MPEPDRPDIDLKALHKHCFKNRQEVLRSDICGCFYCLRMVPPGDIKDWVDDDQTALCGFCGIDSVIGSAAGVEIVPELLASMRSRYF